MHPFRLALLVPAAAILAIACRAHRGTVGPPQREMPIAGFAGCYVLETDGRLVSHNLAFAPDGLRLDTLPITPDSEAAARRALRIDGSWFQSEPTGATAGQWFLRRSGGSDSLFVDFRTGLKGARFGFAATSLSPDSMGGWAGVSVHGDGNETTWRPVQAVRAPCIGVRVGVVRDMAGLPLVSALVTVKGSSTRVMTDTLGRFALPRPVFEPDHIVVRRIGYLPVDKRVGEFVRDSAGRALITLEAPPPDMTSLLPAQRALNIHDDTIPHWELDLAAQAGGYRPLREVSRRAGAPEVRIALHGGIGLPNETVGLRRVRGRVTGELWLWWGPFGAPRRGDSDRDLWRRHAGEYGCPRAPWRQSTSIVDGRSDTTAMLFCRATLGPAPDWSVPWDRLDSLGVWTLPDEGELPRKPWITADGITVTVEVFDGAHYRIYSHGNPSSRWVPESARARGIIDALDEVQRAIVHRARASRPPA